MAWLRRRFGRSWQSASERRLFAELRELKDRVNSLGAVYFPLVERKVTVTTKQIAQLRTDFQALAKEVHDHLHPNPNPDLLADLRTPEKVAPVTEAPRVEPPAPPWNVRLQLLMKAVGWDRQVLAAHAGTHVANMSKILSGKHIPNGPLRHRIAAALGVTDGFIFPAKPPRKRTVKWPATVMERLVK